MQGIFKISETLFKGDEANRPTRRTAESNRRKLISLEMDVFRRRAYWKCLGCLRIDDVRQQMRVDGSLIER